MWGAPLIVWDLIAATKWEQGLVSGMGAREQARRIRLKIYPVMCAFFEQSQPLEPNCIWTIEAVNVIFPAWTSSTMSFFFFFFLIISLLLGCRVCSVLGTSNQNLGTNYESLTHKHRERERDVTPLKTILSKYLTHCYKGVHYWNEIYLKVHEAKKVMGLEVHQCGVPRG